MVCGLSLGEAFVDDGVDDFGVLLLSINPVEVAGSALGRGRGPFDQPGRGRCPLRSTRSRSLGRGRCGRSAVCLASSFFRSTRSRSCCPSCCPLCWRPPSFDQPGRGRFSFGVVRSRSLGRPVDVAFRSRSLSTFRRSLSTFDPKSQRCCLAPWIGIASLERLHRVDEFGRLKGLSQDPLRARF